MSINTLESPVTTIFNKKEIESFISQWERFASCFMWKPPCDSGSRRWYEKTNTMSIDMVINGNRYEGYINVTCSSANVYCKRELIVNGIKKRITALKNAQKSIMI